MPPENDPTPATPEAAGKKKALPTALELRRKEMERRNAWRTHKPNLKTIPWKK